MKIRNIPFGYEVVGGRYVVNNGEAEIISSIYNMYLSGKTLLGIAEALTEQEVTYFEDTKVWNKNMVSRILADEKYLGNETFPQLVDSNNFNLAKNIRAEKGGKKAVLTPLMATVKGMLYCAECGETFSRINKWRTREKWLCKGKCKCSVYLDDRTICESILSVLNRAIREPNLLTAHANNTEYIGSIEVIRKSNEVNRLLEQTEIDYKRAATMILDCASERYKCCVLGGGKHVLNALSSEYDRLTEQSELDEELLKRTVKKITVGHTGEFTVYFIGDIALTNTPKHRVNNLLNVLVVLTVSTALCLVGTSVAWILKGVAFALILLYASVEDFTKREADDCLWVMILLLCITNASGLSLWSMLGGGIIAFVPTLAMVSTSFVMSYTSLDTPCAHGLPSSSPNP